VTVLLLHAFPLDERMWEPQRVALAGHDVRTPQLYGRGQTMATWAESVAGETHDELVLVGASMGGYCALALARLAPERMRGMLLVGSRPDADSHERRAGRAETIELIRREGPDGLWASMEPKLFHDRSKADPDLCFRDPVHLVEAVEAIRDREDSTDVARSLGGRLRFVVGEFDPFVSPQELAEFNVREIAETGHLVNLERPEVFNVVLNEFLDDV
jgi:pimeloyl-ACP methyl ester carboxylesterase